MHVSVYGQNCHGSVPEKSQTPETAHNSSLIYNYKIRIPSQVEGSVWSKVGLGVERSNPGSGSYKEGEWKCMANSTHCTELN
jgi:hypothetical protein